MSCSDTPSLTAGSNYALTYVGASLKILFAWNGFRQPINDTAHQTGLTESKFKLGQTIPVKFQITDAAGTVVQQIGNPTFSRTDYLGACDTTAAPDTLPSVTADNGASFGSNGSTYSYNWSTKGITKPGEYRIFANLADNTRRSVDICLTK